MDNQNRYYSLTIKDKGTCLFETIDELIDSVSESIADPSLEELRIKVIQMTKEEFEAIPELEDW